MKFRRIKTREGFEGMKVWEAGYEFYSSDFNMNSHLGGCYARDDNNGSPVIHDGASIELLGKI